MRIGFAQTSTSGNISLLRLAPDGTRETVAAHYHPLKVYCRADETYLIRYDNFSATTVALELSLQPAPANDDLAAALPLPFTPTPFDLTLAGSQPGETLNQSIWWHYTPPADGVLISKGSLFSGNGIPADLTSIATGSNAPDRHPVSANQTYHLANHYVFSSSTTLIGTLDPRFIPLTSGNDAFADAAPLGTSTHGHLLGNMADAITESDEPDQTGDSLWWKWTAPFDGVLTIDLNCWNCQFPYHYDKIRLFTGSSLAALTPVANPPGWSEYIPIRAYTITSGTTYHLRINRLSGLFDFEYHAFQLPYANDNFAAPSDLGQSTFHEETVFFSGATKQSGEPTHDPAFSPATASRWWTWTAPADMTVDISGPVAAVYLGDSFSNLQPVASDYPFSTGKIHRFPALAGQTYRIALVGRYEQPTFRLSARPSPHGDRFSDPENLGNAHQAVLTTNLTDHTHEPGELPSVFQFGMSHWWQWTAPRDGTVSLTGGITYGIWSFVLGSDLATATYPGDTNIPVTAGQALRIRQRGTEETTRGRNLDFRPFEPNDHFANATDLGSVETTTVTLDTYHATAESGEESLPHTRSLWWKWTPPADGILALTAADENSFSSSVGIAVYLGDSINSITPLRDTSFRPRHFSVLAGETYRIRLASAQAMRFSFDLALLPGVPNDHWMRAIDLGNGTEATGTGTLVDTTPESFSPDDSRAGTAWWKWNAPADGTALIHVSPSKHVLVFANPASGIPLETETINLGLAAPSHAFSVTAGQTVRISVGMKFHSDSGPVNLLVHHLPHPTNASPENAPQLTLDSPATGSFYGITTTGGSEPALWWQWTSPASGPYQLDVDAGTLRVFAETSPGEWSPVAESSTGKLIWGAASGIKHRIAVVGTPGNWSDLSLSLSAATPIRNDAFSNATVLTGNSAKITSHNVDATAEPDEPAHGGTPAERSVWFSWTAQDAGEITVRLVSEHSRIAIYTGDSPASLTPIAADIRDARFQAQPGLIYHIAIDGTRSESFELTVRPFLPPPNNLLSNRIILPPNNPTFSGDLADAGTQPGEPASVTASLWWQWNPPGNSFSTSYYRVEGPEGTEVTLWMHSPNLPTSHSQFFNSVQRLLPGSIYGFQGGTAYHFHLRSTSTPPPSGSVTFRLVPQTGTEPQISVPRPVNDDFQNSIDLGNAPNVRSSAVAFEGITNETGEPLLSSSYRALWWTWTPPATGKYLLRRTTLATAALRVHVGESLETLVPIPLNTGGDILQAEAGVTYRFQVLTSRWDPRFNWSPTRDDTTLGFEITSPPIPATNDHFTNAIPLSGGPHLIPASLRGSTVEPGEPLTNSSRLHSVWWAWTATETGPVTISASNALLAAYSGSFLHTLQPVVAPAYQIRFHATAGLTYWISASESTDARDFSLNIDPSIPPPPHDTFADALALTGLTATAQLATAGASQQPDQPTPGNSSTARTVWATWTAPASDLYDLTISSTTTSNHTLEIFTGDTLDTLERLGVTSSRFRLNASVGTTYTFALSTTSASAILKLDLEASDRPPNDDFANRIHLGDALDLIVHGTTAKATAEPDEILASNSSTATVWWSWTAPHGGSHAVEIESGRPSVRIHTGDSLEALNLSISSFSSTLVPFQAQAGVTYQFSFSNPPGSNGNFSFAIRGNPPANDDFENRIVLESSLPLTFGGRTSLANVQLGEPLFAGNFTARTIWWQWTSPINGPVDLIGPTGITPAARLFTGDTMSFLRSVPITTPANGIQRFSASSGTTYLMGFSAGNNTTTAIRADLELRAARPLPTNDHFANAISLNGGSASSTSHNWGASVETGEPSDHVRSLWWTWTAPRNGSANVNASSGLVRLYRGDSTDSLIPAANPYSNVNLYPVLAGDTFRITVSTTTNQSDVTLNVRMTPHGDDFHDSIILPSIHPPPPNVDLSQMGWEPLEPTHNGKPAEHSVWFRWTAPDNTPVTLNLTSSSQTRISVYTGEALIALTPVAEGSQNVTFIPQRDQTYHIVIDQNAGAFSGQVTLSLSQQLTGYSAWRVANFPDPNSPDANPHADPDGDSRVNLLEMALGTGPRNPDAAPGTLRIRNVSGTVTLSIVRPTGIKGLRYTFEIASALGKPWRDAQEIEHLAWTDPLVDGWEEFHVLLIPLKTADHPSFFARLRIEIP